MSDDSDSSLEDSDEGTDLHVAAKLGNAPMVTQLLKESPALIDGVDDRDRTALHLAAERGHVQVVARLLAVRPQLTRAVDFDHMTALHLAAQHGHDEVVVQLLTHGPDLINALSTDDLTALHLACRAGHLKVVARLLAVNRDIIATRNIDGSTPLHFAAEWGHSEVASHLLAVSPELVDAVDSFGGRTALHYAAQCGCGTIVRQLLSFKPSCVNMKSAAGWSALHLAAREGHEEVLSIFLACQAEHGPDPEGNSLLHRVLMRPFSKEFVRRVWAMDKTALWTRNQGELTPFHYALCSRNDWAVELLQWGLSIDELLATFHDCSQSDTRFRHVVVQQCEPLLQALNRDVVSTVFAYLGLDTRPNKRPRTPRR